MHWAVAEPETVIEFMVWVVAEPETVTELTVKLLQSLRLSHNSWYGGRRA